MQSCWGCESNELPSSAAVNSPPLVFESNSEKRITSESLSSLKDSILRGQTADNLLEITGYYHAGEPTPEGFENMGMARAAQAIELFADKIPEQSIRLKSALRSGDLPDGPFAAVDFDWKVIDIKKAEVVKTADGARIYFPYNSSKKEVDPKIDDYLQQVAKRVVESGERISLVGHTDSKGNAVYNQRLGLERATSIQKILQKYGVARKLISTESRGKVDSVSTNATEEGRHQNRRVELKISQ